MEAYLKFQSEIDPMWWKYVLDSFLRKLPGAKELQYKRTKPGFIAKNRCSLIDGESITKSEHMHNIPLPYQDWQPVSKPARSGDYSPYAVRHHTLDGKKKR